MLNFFRKYQKIFFLFITAMVVVSFVFFGTYQAIAPSFNKEARSENESYESQMARFLDTENWMAYQNFFSANFLNEGIVSKEFLESGFADLIIQKYPERFQQDFLLRLEEEKKYRPYKHPYLPALSAEGLWSIFAPEIPVCLKALQEGKGAFSERSALFLAQKHFPPALLSQIIRYQEQNNPQFPQDRRLSKDGMALFGYQNLTDWFGEQFVATLTEIIIKTADNARKLGYKVTKDELLTEIIASSQKTYESLKGKIDFPVEGGYGLFQLYLRQTDIKEQTALKIWEDISLFKRLMHAVGSASLTDTLALSQFYAKAYENATVELYQIAPEATPKSMEDLKRLECYLAAVGDKCASALDIPLHYSSIEKIEARAPELVGKKYKLYFAQTSKMALQAKVSIKETLQWECDPKNWLSIQRQFPELVQKHGDPFEILEQMEEKGRKLVDAYARKQIVEKHPDWIYEALKNSQLEDKELFLSLCSKAPFEGILDIKGFLTLLDTEDEAVGYTQDNNHYYRFLVQERGIEKEILTYKAALSEGILDNLMERLGGDILVQAVIKACPSEYQEKPYLYRFATFLSKYKEASLEGKLAQQFKIQKNEKTLTRASHFFISFDDALVLNEGSFSELKIDPKEGPYLLKFIQKKVDKTIPIEKVLQCQETLAKEARCRYFQQLLKTF